MNQMTKFLIGGVALATLISGLFLFLNGGTSVTLSLNDNTAKVAGLADATSTATFTATSTTNTKGTQNTQNIAKELWQKYEIHAGTRAIVFALDGPMGAGKTVFTKGLAKTIGIKDEITSPTYDLERTYHLKPTSYNLIHIDAWRMSSGQELSELGFKEKISDKSVIVIEWADRVAQEIRKYSEEAIIIWVKINYGKKENERNLTWDIV